MNLALNLAQASGYKSQPQKIRVLTENWVHRQVYCPNCGQLNIGRYGAGQPVADFYCSKCREDYELKSKKDSIGSKIVDGTYKTMIERLRSSKNPNFFFLNYNPQRFEVLSFLVIPKHFFVP